VAQTFFFKIKNIGKVSGWLINLSKWEKHSWSWVMISLVQKKINAKQIVTSKQITYTKMINGSSTAWRIKAKNIVSTYYHSTLAALTQIFIICTKCWNFQKIRNNSFVESSKLINYSADTRGSSTPLYYGN